MYDNRIRNVLSGTGCMGRERERDDKFKNWNKKANQEMLDTSLLSITV